MGTLVIFNGSAVRVWFSKQMARTVLPIQPLFLSLSANCGFQRDARDLSIGTHGHHHEVGPRTETNANTSSGLFLKRLGSLLPKGLTKGQAEKENISTPRFP